MIYLVHLLPVFLCSRSSSRPPYYPREAESPHRHVRDVPRVERHDSKCLHICSRRGESGPQRKTQFLMEAAVTGRLVSVCQY